MKQTLSILIIAAMLYACKNEKTKAVQQGKETQKTDAPIPAGAVAVTENGWTVKAKVDGKDWEAAAVMPAAEAGNTIGYKNGLEYISFFIFDMGNPAVGKKITLDEKNWMNLSVPVDDKVFKAKVLKSSNGEMEFTKVDDNWAEGKFFFSAVSPNGDITAEVSEGFFRISN